MILITPNSIQMSKVKRSLTVNDLYRSYCLHMKEKNMEPVKKKEYVKNIKVMGEVYREKLLELGIVGLPWGLGDVMIKDHYNIAGKNKGYPSGPSFQRYNGEEKIFFNDHTDGKKKQIFWYSKERKDKKPKTWCFSGHRILKRTMAALLIGGKKYPDFAKLFNV